MPTFLAEEDPFLFEISIEESLMRVRVLKILVFLTACVNVAALGGLSRMW